jgi:hypothetical protein
LSVHLHPNGIGYLDKVLSVMSRNALYSDPSCMFFKNNCENTHGFLLTLHLLRTLPKWMLMPANIKIQKTGPWMASHLGTPSRF